MLGKFMVYIILVYCSQYYGKFMLVTFCVFLVCKCGIFSVSVFLSNSHVKY